MQCVRGAVQALDSSDRLCLGVQACRGAEFQRLALPRGPFRKVSSVKRG